MQPKDESSNFQRGHEMSIQGEAQESGTTATAARKKMWVISGTHWDREWRYTADQSLLRLTQLVDDLLAILEQNPDYACFHLDGGTVVIEDYLAVRPENEARLRKLMREGRVIPCPGTRCRN